MPDAETEPAVLEALITLLVFVVGTGVGWIITVAKTQQQLKDHVKSCDERYEDLKDRFGRVESGVTRLENALLAPRGH